MSNRQFLLMHTDTSSTKSVEKKINLNCHLKYLRQSNWKLGLRKLSCFDIAAAAGNVFLQFMLELETRRWFLRESSVHSALSLQAHIGQSILKIRIGTIFFRYIISNVFWHWNVYDFLQIIWKTEENLKRLPSWFGLANYSFIDIWMNAFWGGHLCQFSNWCNSEYTQKWYVFNIKRIGFKFRFLNTVHWPTSGQILRRLWHPWALLFLQRSAAVNNWAL